MALFHRPKSRDDFEVAIICALPIERNAVEVLLDQEYETDSFSYRKAPGDSNIYTTGMLGNQHVVLAYMPGMGMISAVAVASNIRSSFEKDQKILLGDVVISTSVIQVDFGRQYPNEFIRKDRVEDTLGRANPEIRAFIGKASGHLVRSRLKEKTSIYSAQISTKDKFHGSAYPGPKNDKLYPPDYRHRHQKQDSCIICGDSQNPDWLRYYAIQHEAMKARKEVLGQEYEETLSSIGMVGLAYSLRVRWREAEELQVHAMETSLRVFGVEHPDTLTSIANLASTHSNQGRWKKAEELEVQVIGMRKRVLGTEHPHELTIRANLASTYMSRGRWKEAEELQMYVVETRKRVLGVEPPSTLNSIANLASVYRSQGRWKEAEEIETQALEIRKRVLSVEHPDTLTGMNNLAITWKNPGRDAEALKQMEECAATDASVGY